MEGMVKMCTKLLKMGKMETQEIADWFGVTKKTYTNSTSKYLEKLKEYAEFERVRGGVIIKKIYFSEYIKNYNSTTSKTRRIQAKTLKNCLYFDIGHWDTNYFAIKNINSATKLPTSYFKTLQIKFFTKNDGDDFCIRNIEFCKIKIKTI